MMVGLNVTHRMLPVRVFSMASPPPGTLFATRTAAAEATTYTMPMNASCGTRRSCRGEARVRANSSAPTAVANRAKTYAHVESASTWISNAESPPRAAICASERSTKITSRAITWSPRYDSIATSTIHATNGGIISCRPLISPPRCQSVSRGAAGAEGACELRDPQIHEVEVGIDPRRAAGVRRHDHGFRARLLRHFQDLIAVVVVGREEDLDVLRPHFVDHLQHVPRGGRDAGLRLDVIHTRDVVLPREVIPFFVIAGDRLAAERHRLLEPSTEVIDERCTLVLLRFQEVEQLSLPVQVGESRAAEQLHELLAEQRPVNAVLEVLLPLREVISVLGGDAFQPRQDVTGDLDGIERTGPDVWVAVHEAVALGAGVARGHVEQVDTGVGCDVARPSFRYLGIVRFVE